MKIIVAAASAALVLAAASAASAADRTSGVYGILGYQDSEGLAVVQARLGYRFEKYVGVEVEGGLGVKDDTVKVSGVNVKLKEENQSAAYVVGFLPVSDKLDLFVRGGYGRAHLKASVPGFSASGGANDWAYGAGGQYLFDGKNGVRVEYTKFSSGDYSNSWSVAYVHQF